MITLFGCAADDNKLYELDNAALSDDSGDAIEASFTMAPMDFGTKAAAANLRRIDQMITLANPCTIKITPIVDGNDVPDQAQTFAVDSSLGVSRLLEAHVQRLGNEFQFRVDVLALSGVLAFGAGSLWAIPRRTTRV